MSCRSIISINMKQSLKFYTWVECLLWIVAEKNVRSLRVLVRARFVKCDMISYGK